MFRYARMSLVIACVAWMTAAVAVEVSSLAEQLKTGLKVKAPGDVAFCEKVAELVQRGKLPEKYVDSAYAYAINRGKKYPFPAFERIIRLQASKLGVSL